MNDLKPEELIQAEKYIEMGEFDKTLNLLNIFERKSGIDHYHTLYSYYLRGQLLIWQGKYEEAIKMSEEMYRLSQLYDDQLQSIDALVLLSHIYTYQYNDDKALNIIEQAKKLLKKISQESSEVFLKREAHLLFCQGLIYFHKGDFVRTLDYLERSVSLREKIGNKQEIAQSLWAIGRILAYHGKIDRALNVLKRCLIVAMEGKNLFYVGISLNSIGVIYFFEGKFNRGLINFEKSLAIFKKIHNKPIISGILNNISGIYHLKGELSRALEYIEHSLALEEDIGLEHLKIGSLDTAIQIALEVNDINQAQKYFERLEKINEQEGSEQINFIYLYNKALILKLSSLKSDQIKAREILMEIVEKKIPFIFETTVKALLNLCDILLTELHNTSNLQLLDQIRLYIYRILDIAKEQNSYWLLAETHLFQAKLKLLTFEFKEAQKLLIIAMHIAEKYGQNILAERIRGTQYQLLNEKSKWEILRNSKAIMAERIELAHFNDQIGRMLRKRFTFKKLV